MSRLLPRLALDIYDPLGRDPDVYRERAVLRVDGDPVLVLESRDLDRLVVRRYADEGKNPFGPVASSVGIEMIRRPRKFNVTIEGLDAEQVEFLRRQAGFPHVHAERV